jgi:8-oxo-dGTP pyrophosphatase MutT (NUDIX family)
MSEIHKPKQAGTVILLRPAQSGSIEVLLTRRPDEMAFLGGMYCFPGGTVQKQDFSAAILRRCHGLSPTAARKIVGSHFIPQEALGLWVAAIRELFEEVGVLLAITRDGRPAAMDRDLNHRLAKQHTALLARDLSFNALLEAENLQCDTSRLAYFSYWQTPSQFKVRFDTRFFLASVPADHPPLAVSPEVAHSIWLTPDRALQLFDKGNLPMIFPTFASLRALADFDSLDSLFAEFKPARARSLAWKGPSSPLIENR